MVLTAREVVGRGLSRYKAAQQSEMDAPTLGRILKGERPVGATNIGRLRTAFGIDANSWFEDAAPAEREEWARCIRELEQRAVDNLLGRATS